VPFVVTPRNGACPDDCGTSLGSVIVICGLTDLLSYHPVENVGVIELVFAAVQYVDSRSMMEILGSFISPLNQFGAGCNFVATDTEHHLNSKPLTDVRLWNGFRCLIPAIGEYKLSVYIIVRALR